MKSTLLFIIAMLLNGSAAFPAEKVSREDAVIVARNFYFERINQFEKISPQTTPMKGSDNRDAMTFTESSGDTLKITMDLKNMAFWKLASLPQ